MQAGWSAGDIADQMNVSPATVYKWWRRQVPAGGGWRAYGRGVVPQRDRVTAQLDYVHSVIDAFSRVAYVEVWPDETGETCTGVFERAVGWFAERGVTIEAVLSDNGP